jgi:hypothetical protein
MSQKEDQAIAAPDALSALFDDEALVSVLAALAHEEEETRIVGGALRDALFGRTVREIDLATTLLPEAVMAQAKASGLRAIPTGLQHGTVTLLAGAEAAALTLACTDGTSRQVPRNCRGGRQVQGKTRLVDRSAGQTAPGALRRQPTSRPIGV